MSQALLHGDPWNIHSFLRVPPKTFTTEGKRKQPHLKKSFWQWCQLRNLSRSTSSLTCRYFMMWYLQPCRKSQLVLTVPILAKRACKSCTSHICSGVPTSAPWLCSAKPISLICMSFTPKRFYSQISWRAQLLLSDAVPNCRHTSFCTGISKIIHCENFAIGGNDILLHAFPKGTERGCCPHAHLLAVQCTGTNWWWIFVF